MFFRKGDGAIGKRSLRVWRVSSLAIFLLPQVGLAAPLEDLIGKAKKEGALNATVTVSMTGRSIPNLAAAFKKRFGLDISVTLTPVSDVADTPKAIAEIRTGVVPTYDAVEGADVNKFTLMQAGGAIDLAA